MLAAAMNRPHDTKEFLRIKNIVVAKFLEEHWLELGMVTESLDVVQTHHRLLRSLAWNDSDYGGNAMDVLLTIAQRTPDNFRLIKDYVDQKFPADDEVFVSAKPNQRRVTFSPNVFEVPEVTPDDNLVSVMMPFSQEFQAVYDVIKSACADAGFTCKRADDIWNNSILVQDIFRLIFESRVVVSDFTGRNPNVMYETGIAHALGKTVIPITQDAKDVPFDLVHHRFLRYLSNREGLATLAKDLAAKLSLLRTATP